MNELRLLLFTILMTTFSSCSDDDNQEAIDTPNFRAKLLKQTTTKDGYFNKYFYNERNELNLITRTSFRVPFDSTKFEYANGSLERVVRRSYGDEIVSFETLYDRYDSNGAAGSFKSSLEDGRVLQENTFEYSFSDSLIKNIKFFNLDGTLRQEKVYTHDENGNLTKWTQTWYFPDGQIDTFRESIFTDFETSGIGTQTLLFWEYYRDNLPNLFVSKNNFLKQIETNISGDMESTRELNYSFEYDTDGNVIQQSSIDEQKQITLEYYE